MFTKAFKSFLIYAFLAGNGSFCVADAYAYSVSIETPISFGTIVADPAGDIIEINAAGGPAGPRVITSGHSYIKDGHSGMIRIEADQPDQLISIEYPTSVRLKSGDTDLILDGIASRSISSVTSSTAGPIDFHIGGLLHIDRGQAGSDFSGKIKVTITVHNP